MSLLRVFLIILAVSAAYVGLQETRLRLHCSERLDLTLSELRNEKSHGPIWVHLDTSTLATEAAIVSSHSGAKRGVWLPVTDSPESTTVLAVLQAKDLKAMRKIATSATTLPIEGLAYYPSVRKSKILRTYLRQAGLTVSPDLRVVDLGRKPGNLYAGLSLLFVATAVLLWIAVGVLRRGGWSGHRSKKTTSPMGVHTLAEMKETPLPEETRMEVSHMLSDVWDRIEAR